MKILMLWGQRVCCEGEYAPELLEVVSEYQNNDNPEILNEAYKKYCCHVDFSHVAIVEASLQDSTLEEILKDAHIELENKYNYIKEIKK